MIWRPLEPILFNLFRPETGLAKPFEGVTKLRVTFRKLLPRVETWVYKHHISDYFSDTLPPRPAARLPLPLFRPCIYVPNYVLNISYRDDRHTRRLHFELLALLALELNLQEIDISAGEWWRPGTNTYGNSGEYISPSL